MSSDLLQDRERQTLGRSIGHAVRTCTGVLTPAEIACRSMLVILLAVLLVHGVGVGRDFVTAIQYPYELDYGEGIVWQQTVLIPGPRMYSLTTQLPFIVFHYPPVYYLLTHVLALARPDLLSAGRTLSCLSAIVTATMVTSLILATTTSRDRNGLTRRWCCALVGGLLIFSAFAVRCWAMFMRVDLLAEAIALSGVLVAARANNSVIGTTCSLILCVAAVYCKQTELPAGMSVFAITLVFRPRAALIAGGLAVMSGIIPLVFLQRMTHGGFLHNILIDNVNRMSMANAVRTLTSQNSTLPLFVAAIVSAAALLYTLRSGLISNGPVFLRAPANQVRLMLLAQFGLASLLLFTVFKSGGSINYFIDWLSVGCTLIGACLYDLLKMPRVGSYLLILLCAYSVLIPFRLLAENPLAAERASDALLVQRIARASRPVASEDMVLLMRAGKPVIFEPSIVTELAALGRWDERPLVTMIAAHGFEFMVTCDNLNGPTVRRSPAVAAAMLHSYPIAQQVGPSIWLRLPDPRTKPPAP